MGRTRIKRLSPRFDITGKKFNKLTALSYVGSEANSRMWRCKCDCGEERIVSYNHLNKGNVTTCGKCRIETDKRVSHKLSHTAEYRI